jgi:hypothetical protein
MNPLLLLGGLAAARRSIGEAVRRTARSFGAYAILTGTGLVALGFFTAGGFLYIASMWGAVSACMIVAAAYAILGGAFFLTIRAPSTAHALSQAQPLPSPTPQREITATEGRELPGSVIAVGLLAAAGYLAGRSMTRWR